jgi:hypothetical protein
MPTLVIDGLTVPIRAGRIPKRLEDTAVYRRRWLGDMDMEVLGPGGRVAEWTPTTKRITRAEADALEAIVNQPGTHTITGDAAGTTLVAYTRPISRAEPLYDQVEVTIGVRAVAP